MFAERRQHLRQLVMEILDLYDKSDEECLAAGYSPIFVATHKKDFDLDAALLNVPMNFEDKITVDDLDLLVKTLLHFEYTNLSISYNGPELLSVLYRIRELGYRLDGMTIAKLSQKDPNTGEQLTAPAIKLVYINPKD